jgi:hypothetical protein
MKLIVRFGNFAKAPKKIIHEESKIYCIQILGQVQYFDPDE